ncbi:hypothetical protein K505DRAFT_355540 [Melanomma pulvis-pyrius CBS 109.77]|uniref:PIG-L family deacetylase n=1 Tax=Melanomma pulvis-pyrius CBS 109.77 TaxID=1314802 RepID=A0A6A6XVV2_9PLEO|nr:hypothetical protein K505DRAFT_355540 [Melanomma pulvis-pyrius CBS 109.77]
MFILSSTRAILFLLFVAVAIAGHIKKPAKSFIGSIYFSAHPADSLLFQNPDLFHDFYVFKCITVVVFTSADRGITGNFSNSLERGLEDAYSYMAGRPMSETAWSETRVKLNGKAVLIRSLRETSNVQILYLRLPDGATDGEGYAANNKESLKKLYRKKIRTVTAIDGSATYTLDTLKGLIATVLKQRKARDIRVLDFKTPVPEQNEMTYDHTDHSVSARIVVEVLKRDKIKGNLTGYAGSFMRKLDPTINGTEFTIKVDTFFQYASHDKHMCQDYVKCLEKSTANVFPDDDVKYVSKFLDREYYVH